MLDLQYWSGTGVVWRVILKTPLQPFGTGGSLAGIWKPISGLPAIMYR
jgi:hypothetical protein